MMWWHDGDKEWHGGAQGQNPFADIMRQMQEMQQQQGGSTLS